MWDAVVQCLRTAQAYSSAFLSTVHALSRQLPCATLPCRQHHSLLHQRRLLVLLQPQLLLDALQLQAGAGGQAGPKQAGRKCQGQSETLGSINGV